MICAICYEEMSDSAFTTVLECIHIFHDTCLETWLQCAASCPVCRQSVAAPCAAKHCGAPRATHQSHDSWAASEAERIGELRTMFYGNLLDAYTVSDLLEDPRVFRREDLIWGIQNSKFDSDDLDYMVEQGYVSQDDVANNLSCIFEKSFYVH